MIKDRIALDLPDYDGLLAGHYRKEPGYGRRREEGTDDWLLVGTLAGEGRFGTSEGDVAAPPGSLALLAPGTPHDYGSGLESWELLWVHFHPPREWRDLLAWPSSAPGFSLLAANDWPSVERAFREVILTAHRRRLGANALERLLILVHDELPGAARPLDGRIERALEHIHSHLGHDLSVERLSRVADLSVSRFSHLFRAEVGVAPSQYVDLQRMGRAKTLLGRTSLSVKEIAAAVGMEPFHFSTRFRVYTGQSPRAYRAERLT